MSGRATAYVIRPEADAWLVRHYQRGGSIARVLHDRYLASTDRALHELRVSVQARAAGIPSPEVVAAIKYPAGIFARFDIAVAYIEGSHDLADALFGRDQAADPEIAKAAVLIHTMIVRGLIHADLNVKNILISAERAYIVDLDRCRVVDGVSQSEANAMRKRFFRSVEKWQSRTGRFMNDRHRRQLEEAFYV